MRTTMGRWMALPTLLRAGAVLGVAMLIVASAAGLLSSRSIAEEARAIPPPAIDEPIAPSTPGVAVVAGGCFWGVQGVFQHVEGVTSAVSGYAGGEAATARYPAVSAGTTGHAESVRIT